MTDTTRIATDTTRIAIDIAERLRAALNEAIIALHAGESLQACGILAGEQMSWDDLMSALRVLQLAEMRQRQENPR